MSVAYEPRNFMHDGSYPNMDDHNDSTPDTDRFTDPSDPVVSELATVVAFPAPASTNFVEHVPEPVPEPQPVRLELSSLPLHKGDSPSAPATQRIRPIAKPDREITKNLDGKFVCSWPGCTEDVKEFSRKCEWNKHMDKHDRPYKCAAEGCEKLPGFTYSGGLLRHEREVHGKHGGPKNSLNCPHVNCKRHTGKGFSRLENLNEHLRRVHTQNGIANGTEGESDEVASDAGGQTNGQIVGQKRKRDPEEVELLREEVKRLRQENEELRRQVDNQNQQTVAMMQQINQLQEALGQLQPRIVPAAPML